MAGQGPFLTSCIIFYLSIGAAIFQILEEENWKNARAKYEEQMKSISSKHECLTKGDLDEILKVVLEAVGQGVTVTGENHRPIWSWENSVIFAASIVTTIGYGNTAPKTKGGRIFCILYGLCGIPLCLVWISKLGSFFGDRAKRLSGVMLRKGISVAKVQHTCTALFLLWGLLVHLVIPPFVFMSVEGWSYLEGFYFSFITLTTVGFGDYVAGVNPDIQYPSLYRVITELWIYMGLAWLSLFFSWNVHMVVDAHKVLKKKWRHRHRNFYDEELQSAEDKPDVNAKPNIVDIFNFLSEKEQDYNTVVKEIGMIKKQAEREKINRSKSCNDLTNIIQTLDHSPRLRRMRSELFINMQAEMNSDKEDEEPPLIQESTSNADPELSVRSKDEQNKGSLIDSENDGTVIAVPAKDTTEEEIVQHPDGGETRFKISKIDEKDLLLAKDEKG